MIRKLNLVLKKGKLIAGNMHYWILGVICIISSLCLSCKRCETRYEPDFTEDELSWVKFKDKAPVYEIRYKDNVSDIWLLDTVETTRGSGIPNTLKISEGKCKDNILFKQAAISIQIYSGDHKGGFSTSKIEIKKLNSFSVYLGYFRKTIEPKAEIRKDTATIGNHFYNDIYRDSNHEFSISYSKKYGLVQVFNRIDSTEANLIPKI